MVLRQLTVQLKEIKNELTVIRKKLAFIEGNDSDLLIVIDDCINAIEMAIDSFKGTANEKSLKKAISYLEPAIKIIIALIKMVIKSPDQ